MTFFRVDRDLLPPEGDQDGAMQSSLRFGNLSRISGRTLRVRLMSVTDNTSAADPRPVQETKIGFNF